jgi:hypothetical protein
MNSQSNNNRTRTDIKPTEISRWEGEGGNPPRATQPKRAEISPGSVAGILRRLLIDWHIINSRQPTR